MQCRIKLIKTLATHKYKYNTSIENAEKSIWHNLIRLSLDIIYDKKSY